MPLRGFGTAGGRAFVRGVWCGLVVLGGAGAALGEIERGGLGHGTLASGAMVSISWEPVIEAGSDVRLDRPVAETVEESWLVEVPTPGSSVLMLCAAACFGTVRRRKN